MRSMQYQLESWEPSQHSLIDKEKSRKTCAEMAGRRTFRILTSSQQNRQLKYARQQYTHSKTIHMRKQRYTQDNNTIQKRSTTVSSNAHRKSNTMGRKYY